MPLLKKSLVDLALRQAELLVAARPVSDRILGEAASTLVVAGQVAEAIGQHEAAKMRWQRAVDLIAAQLTKSGDWRLLDPAVRALALLGRTAESGELVARLERIGYVPLEPFLPRFVPTTQPNSQESSPMKKKTSSLVPVKRHRRHSDRQSHGESEENRRSLHDQAERSSQALL